MSIFKWWQSFKDINLIDSVHDAIAQIQLFSSLSRVQVN